MFIGTDFFTPNRTELGIEQGTSQKRKMLSVQIRYGGYKKKGRINRFSISHNIMYLYSLKRLVLH